MKCKQILLATVLALSVAAPFPAQSPAPASQREFRKGEVIVELKPGASVDSVNQRIGTTTFQQIYGTNFYRLFTPRNKKEVKFRRRLERDSDVLSASLNPTISNLTLFGRSTFSFPGGFAAPGFTQEDFDGQQQLFNLLRLDDVHIRSKGKGIVVAIIDTGLDSSHPALTPLQLWTDDRVEADVEGDGIDNDGDGLVDDYRGWDFLQNDNDPSEIPGDPRETIAGHGTFIAALIAKVAPECRIMPVRVFPPDGVGDAFTVASAIKYAVDHGADVINLSFGASEVSGFLEDAIEYAKEQGVVMVAAAGNENSESQQFPAKSEHVLGVAAIDLRGMRAPFSNFGSHIDVTAPGVDLISAFPGQTAGGFAEWSGTSFAAPFAAGEAALVKAFDPAHPDIRQLIIGSAIPIDNDNPGFTGKLGKGRVSPLNAIECLNTNCVRAIREVHATASLLRAGGVASGGGQARISLGGSKQTFEVTASGLSPRLFYRLVVDGVEVAQGRPANSLGDIKFQFSTEPGFLPLTGRLNPVTNIKHIELRDAATARLILVGDFRSGDAQRPNQTVIKEARLASATVASSAGGRAIIEVRPEREMLTIEAEGLTPGVFYLIGVDGISLGGGSEVVRGGYLRMVFTSDGAFGLPLPSALRPAVNVRHVELREQSGRIVLQGDFRPGGGDIGGSDLPLQR